MKTFSIYAEAIAQSDDAILVEDEDGEEVWVPQSQIHDASEVWKKGDSGTLVVTEWIAIKKGWL
jgi:hypothetical protein